MNKHLVIAYWSRQHELWGYEIYGIFRELLKRSEPHYLDDLSAINAGRGAARRLAKAAS